MLIYTDIMLNFALAINNNFKNMRTIDLSKEKMCEVLNSQMTKIALIGKVSLNDSCLLSRYKLDVLDLSSAVFGTEQEEWCQFLGYSHCGPVYGNSGVKEVEVLKRVLQEVNTRRIILPDDVARRHINTIKNNTNILSVEVGENCKLFTMKDGQVYNKRGTLLVFEQRA